MREGGKLHLETGGEKRTRLKSIGCSIGPECRAAHSRTHCLLTSQPVWGRKTKQGEQSIIVMIFFQFLVRPFAPGGPELDETRQARTNERTNEWKWARTGSFKGGRRWDWRRIPALLWRRFVQKAIPENERLCLLNPTPLVWIWMCSFFHTISIKREESTTHYSDHCSEAPTHAHNTRQWWQVGFKPLGRWQEQKVGTELHTHCTMKDGFRSELFIVSTIRSQQKSRSTLVVVVVEVAVEVEEMVFGLGS